jgi:hypothetical protein
MALLRGNVPVSGEIEHLRIVEAGCQARIKAHARQKPNL